MLPSHPTCRISPCSPHPSCGAVGPLSSPPCCSPPCSPHTLFVGYLTPPSLLPSHPTCGVSPCLSSHPSCRVSPFSLLPSPQLWGCRTPQPSFLFPLHLICRDLPSPLTSAIGISMLPSHPTCRVSPCLSLHPSSGYPHAPLIPAVGLWDPSLLPLCSPHTPF